MSSPSTKNEALGVGEGKNLGLVWTLPAARHPGDQIYFKQADCTWAERTIRVVVHGFRPRTVQHQQVPTECSDGQLVVIERGGCSSGGGYERGSAREESQRGELVLRRRCGGIDRLIWAVKWDLRHLRKYISERGPSLALSFIFPLHIQLPPLSLSFTYPTAWVAPSLSRAKFHGHATCAIHAAITTLVCMCSLHVQAFTLRHAALCPRFLTLDGWIRNTGGPLSTD